MTDHNPPGFDSATYIHISEHARRPCSELAPCCVDQNYEIYYAVHQGYGDFKSVVVFRWRVDARGYARRESQPCVYSPTLEMARSVMGMLGAKNRLDPDAPDLSFPRQQGLVEIWT